MAGMCQTVQLAGVLGRDAPQLSEAPPSEGKPARHRGHRSGRCARSVFSNVSDSGALRPGQCTNVQCAFHARLRAAFSVRGAFPHRVK
jgi:hypothetical protein